MGVEEAVEAPSRACPDRERLRSLCFDRLGGVYITWLVSLRLHVIYIPKQFPGVFLCNVNLRRKSTTLRLFFSWCVQLIEHLPQIVF